MIEQFLQTALEFFKEIWFQLNSRFGLEDTEAFKFLKPYLIQLQDNPLYMGISLAALFLLGPNPPHKYDRTIFANCS